MPTTDLLVEWQLISMLLKIYFYAIIDLGFGYGWILFFKISAKIDLYFEV